MKKYPPHLKRLETLEKIDRVLAASPDLVEERYQRACLLDELGRTQEAKMEILEVLKREPAHFGSLNRLGIILHATGFQAPALSLYRDIVLKHPSNPIGHVNLANALSLNNEEKEARLHLETALRLDPENWAANHGMASLLAKLEDMPNAKRYWDKAFRQKPVYVLPYRGENPPVSVLLLETGWGGSVILGPHLDDRLFQVTVLYVEYFDPSQPLPPHQKVMNGIGDADHCRPDLEIALQLLEKTSAPILNHPSKVIPTGRQEVLKKLGAIPGVIAPRISFVPRDQLMGPRASNVLKELGFSFPFLVRSLGFHEGKHFIYVENEEALRKQLPALPGENLLAIEYLDSRSSDGKIRKYRVMMIDGKLYPLHAAISHDWKIHFFSAEMSDNPENREEDLEFLNQMPEVLGKTAMKALGEICPALRLDYAGVDFGLDAKGNILLFEANATMAVKPVDADPRWDYRRPGVQKVLDAIQRMLLKR